MFPFDAYQAGALMLGDNDPDIYQRAAVDSNFSEMCEQPIYLALGICGEAGELAEHIKKTYRDNGGVFDDAKVELIKKELGDIMWYSAVLAARFNLTLSEIAQANLEKINARKERGTLQGSGDNR